jgi:DNA end-binding protein Ku
VRKPGEVFDDLKSVKLDEDMVELAADIVDKKKAKFDPAKFEDHYETALIELVRTKKAGKKLQKAKPETKPSNVVNLFDALRKSLAEDAGKSDDEPAPRKKSDGADKEKGEKTKPKSSSKSKSA